MKAKIKYLFILFVFVIVLYIGYVNVTANEYISPERKIEETPQVWNPAITNSINSKDIGINIDGTEIVVKRGRIYMDESMSIMLPTDLITESFDCAINLYDNTLVIERGNTKIVMKIGNYDIFVNDKEKTINVAPVKKGEVIYVPLVSIVENFGYSYNFDISSNRATLVNENPKERSLPYSYCYKDIGKLPSVKNQGYFGTCWASAALTALETTLEPEYSYDFAIDHMSINNSFNISQYDGGDYLMAMAYLTAWQGPVLTANDPYGDGVSDNTLLPVKHVQEVQIIPAKDFESIKKMVYKYGGVSTSLYTSLTDSYGTSKYYNKETYAYCYMGENKPNHEVVIVGWDDNYPKENFNLELEGNGAFICQNSWGEQFGDNGLFYVSYYDTNIGIHNIVYTKVEDVDNYKNIYQSDLCGWRGNLGYERESAYFANVYTAKGPEYLKAVSFYATDVDTYYEIAVCKDFSGIEDFNEGDKEILASGTLKNSGYYTIELDKAVELVSGKKFAIIMYISTPNATRPVAVEIATDYKSSSVDLSDGEGYISYSGKIWESVEEIYGCNLCLKGFTNN